MTEDESYKKSPDYMRGQIETLQQILRVTIAAMTDKQRKFICDAAEEYAGNAEMISQDKDTDPARDKASAAYEIAQSIKEAEDWVSEFKERK